MICKTMFYRSVLLLMLTSNTLLANESQDVYGVWLTETNSAQIKLETCEQSVCGNIIWINSETLDAGLEPETVRDGRNKDPDLRQRNLLGMSMLWGFKPARKGWSGGKIYDPKSGKTYASKIKRLDEDTLEVKGCISLFCKTQIWKKYNPKNK